MLMKFKEVLLSAYRRFHHYIIVWEVSRKYPPALIPKRFLLPPEKMPIHYLITDRLFTMGKDFFVHAYGCGFWEFVKKYKIKPRLAKFKDKIQK